MFQYQRPVPISEGAYIYILVIRKQCTILNNVWLTTLIETQVVSGAYFISSVVYIEAVCINGIILLQGVGLTLINTQGLQEAVMV